MGTARVTAIAFFCLGNHAVKPPELSCLVGATELLGSASGRKEQACCFIWRLG
jgi:hypothetical protein